MKNVALKFFEGGETTLPDLNILTFEAKVVVIGTVLTYRKSSIKPPL